MKESGLSVWMLGTGRCGTGMFARMMKLSPNVRAFHDSGPLHPPTWENGTPLSGLRIRRAQDAWRDGKVYVESAQPLTRAAPKIAAQLPRSKFVHLHRDPRNVMISAYHRLNWYGAKIDVDPVRAFPHPDLWPLDDEASARWDDMKRIERCIWRWTAVNRWILDFVATLPTRCFILPASALFAPDLSKIFALCDWAEMERPDAEAVIDLSATKVDYKHHKEREYGPWPREWDQYLPRDLMEILEYD
jgi:hypothetical protein